MNSVRQCEECKTVLPAGSRVDKRFCTDACKTSFHNKSRQAKNNSLPEGIKRINAQLLKNREILIRLNPEGTKKLKRQKLYEKGFIFGLITSYSPTRTGQIYHFCYEQGYLEVDQEYVVLVRREELVED